MCRRQVILEYFGEEKVLATDSSFPCCDVCGQKQETRDCSNEIRILTQSLSEVPNIGEKKVKVEEGMQPLYNHQNAAHGTKNRPRMRVYATATACTHFPLPLVSPKLTRVFILGALLHLTTFQA
jgi:superfamily II DNA helicase RecQ